MGQSVEDKETRKAQPHVGCHHDNGVHCDIEMQRCMKGIGSIEDLTRSELTTEAVGMSSILISRQSI